MANNINQIVDMIAPNIIEVIGSAYGYALDLPATFNPDAYLCGAIGHPTNVLPKAVDGYVEGVSTFRRRMWAGASPWKGYLREVYPINFILDTHLRMPFHERSLAEFMERAGKLGPSGLHPALYRWDVLAGDLEAVRQDLTPSGIVLSSEASLLRRH